MERENPLVEEGVLHYFSQVLMQRASVSVSGLEERARNIAERNGISDFKASRSCLKRFLRRTGIQISVLLNGIGRRVKPADHAERMQELREISYKLCE